MQPVIANTATIQDVVEPIFDVDNLIEYSPEYNDIASDHICLTCNLTFDTASDVRLHHAVAHNGWPLVHEESTDLPAQVVYVCSLCQRQYDLREDLRGHMIEYHKYKAAAPTVDAAALTGEKPKAGVEKLDIIEKTPKSTISKSVTTAVELRPLPFKDFRLLLRQKMLKRCSFSRSCIYKFETTAKLETHVKCHVKIFEADAKYTFNCSLCGVGFDNWRLCSTHLWKVHQLNVDMLQCPVCEFKAHASVLVWRHMRVHKKWRPRVLRSLRAVRDRRQSAVMPQQQQRTSAAAVEQPKVTAPPTKNKYYSEKTCEICQRKFVNGKTLSKHVKSVHNKIKPFICNVCGKKLTRKASLIVHMRQHTGEKPLQCKVCKFATRDPSVLKKHQMGHEESGKQKCNYCSYICIQTNSFKRHMRLKHPDEYLKISCNLCSFVTINERRLQAHKQDHELGLIVNKEDSLDATAAKNTTKTENKATDDDDKNLNKTAQHSTDYFLPLDTGGVTIPAPTDEALSFPAYLNN